MPDVAKIEIVLNDAGQVSVTGSIENKLIAYGLMYSGLDAIKQFHEEASKRLITAPTPGDLHVLTGGKKN